MKKNAAKLKPLVSCLLFIDFLIVTLTGIGLYFAPVGRIARFGGWNFLGMDKFTLKNFHTITSFIFVLLIVLHFALNFRVLIAEIKSITKKK